MKKAQIIGAILVIVVMASPAYCFVDYLFGGSSRGAIDNSALGDLRAWWTGNPAYQFNPYYSRSGLPQQAQQVPPSTIGAQQQQQMYYYPQQAAPGTQQYYQQGSQNPYVPNYGAAAGQLQAPPPPVYQNPAYRGYSAGAQQPAPQYQGVPQQQYQAAPQQQYQMMTPQYQGQAPAYPGRQ